MRLSDHCLVCASLLSIIINGLVAQPPIVFNELFRQFSFLHLYFGESEILICDRDEDRIWDGRHVKGHRIGHWGL